WLMMSLWDALRMNMMISYQELVRTFPSLSLKATIKDDPEAKTGFGISSLSIGLLSNITWIFFGKSDIPIPS
ncbi:hypothetical protein, partial [Klebsiella pneumoniae]|uniref:hypothetical protein n=1 Tax=Klebsiella pneumoniae TaxID=573 RepID=UPI001A981ED6